MTPDEFRDQIDRQAAHLPEGARRIARECYVQNRMLERRHCSHCVILAGQIAEECARMLRAISQSDEAIQPLEETTLSRVVADQLGVAITPTVQQLRESLFGAEGPPLSGERRAAEWIEAEHQREQADLADSVRERGEEWARTLREEAYGWPGLSYRGRGQKEQWRAVRPDLRLGAIALAARRLANATGFTEAEIVDYILIGNMPELAPARVRRVRHWTDLGSLLGGKGPRRPLERRQVVLEINTPDMTLRHLRDAYQKIRKLWDGQTLIPHNRQAAWVTRGDERLWKAMKSMGYADRSKLTKAEWKALASEWNTAVSWDALRKRWARLQDKLERLSPIGAPV